MLLLYRRSSNNWRQSSLLTTYRATVNVVRAKINEDDATLTFILTGNLDLLVFYIQPINPNQPNWL